MKSLLLAVVVVYSAIVTAQVSSNISGTVLDTAGGVIANADIAVHWNIRVADGPSGPTSNDVMQVLFPARVGPVSLDLGRSDPPPHPALSIPS